MKTTAWQRYKYAAVYNFSRMGSFWRGWADAIDGTWEDFKHWLIYGIRTTSGLVISFGWPLIALLATVWKLGIWPLSYIFTRKSDIEAFMENHPEPDQRIKRNFTI